MKNLFITPFLPYPPDDGGRNRMYNLIKYLSKNFTVDIFSLISSNKELQYFHELKRICRNVYSAKKNIKKEISEIITSEKYNIIHVEKFFMTQYMPDIKSSISILDPWGIDSEGIFRFCKYEKNWVKKFKLYTNFISTKFKEKKFIKRFDYVIAVSQKDKDYFGNFIDKEKIFILSNCVDCNYFNVEDLNKVNPISNSLLFTGIMNYKPNVDAMLYFYEKIYPMIKKEIPSIKIFIVGKNPSTEIQSLRKNSDFIVAGYVDDIRYYFSMAEVCIVPMRMGGGTRFKVLEALAMKKPVVSTSVGCEGIDVKHNENILIADNETEFAQFVIDLLKNPEIRNKLGNSARNFVKEKYSWEDVMPSLTTFYKSIVKK